MQTMYMSEKGGHEASCFSTPNSGGAFYDVLQFRTTLYYPIVHNLLFFVLRGDYLEIWFN